MEEGLLSCGWQPFFRQLESSPNVFLQNEEVGLCSIAL